MNPIHLFYAKLLQYFTYAGIKTVNVHVQASFVFAATFYFYFMVIIGSFPIAASDFFKVITLATCPILQMIAYYHFKNEKRSNELRRITEKENTQTNVISSLLTIAAILPMVVFFTITVFNS
ncbi:hypothetical protein ABN763_08210 [Spongiivirga sp. MCCC 1A20706]|uniref:hypothetical protein n=1 Tax=Spongiivirga sp. MCCC 1A20706 TaxID=3160963 RepID=UPI0039779D79